MDSGLPVSMVKDKDARTWYTFAVAYVHAWWPHAAAKSREGMTDALANITPVLTKELAGRPDDEMIRKALREYSFLPEDRRPSPTPEIAKAVRWIEAASLPLSALEEAKHTRAVLEALALRMDGKAAATSTYRRKRAVFHHVLEYAVELEELSANPLHKVKLRKIKAMGEIDRRSVVNPAQARELLTAVTYVGRSRGRMMTAMFACMYFGGLRPGEASALRQKDCHLPETGWGRLTLEKTMPETNSRYTDSGESRDERGLKHREQKATRLVPIPPELVEILRRHIEEHGVAQDGRLFRTSSGKPFPGSTVSKVWREARTYAFTPDQVASPLAGRPYDLRHAAVSLWLNAGVHAPEAAERAGHGVDVMLRVYAKCIDGQREVANQRILDALAA
ncbi:tyrosine-type recombinase/integrase [Nonomuraea pusilla]|uniref:tyrosine-type recombinase/integrase n=1 Tax=Nonomuraea pusilla TaxID=46177 RepID=UPI00332243A7